MATIPHNSVKELTIKNPQYVGDVLRFTRDELVRDLGEVGDITTDGLFADSKKIAEMCVISRQAGVFAGAQEVAFFLTSKDSSVRAGIKPLKVRFVKADGDIVKPNDLLFVISGRMRDILRIERVVLNLVGRMSGVATIMNHIVKITKSTRKNLIITPTRKTLWGLLDKRACALGGGGTHRLNLSDGILIKDNHLDAFDRDITLVLNHFKLPKKSAGSTPKFFEVEVETRNEAITAATILAELQKKNTIHLPCFLLLDNQTPSQVSVIIRELKKRKLRNHVGVEVSGGITEKNVEAYAKTGADVISMGSITHSASNFDLTLQPYGGGYGKPLAHPSRQRKI